MCQLRRMRNMCRLRRATTAAARVTIAAWATAILTTLLAPTAPVGAPTQHASWMRKLVYEP